MKSQIGVVIIVCFIVLNSLLSGVFAQTLSLNQNVPLKTSKPCKQDWECRSLNITITLDQPKCYDRVRYYTGQEEIFEALDRMASRVSKSHSFVK